MENETKTIFFFDDWLLQYRCGTERKWFQAEILPEYETLYSDDGLELSFNGPNVLRTNEGLWRMWATGYTDLSNGDEGGASYLYCSENGVDWKPDKDIFGNYCVFKGEYAKGGHKGGDAIFRGKNERESARQFTTAELPVTPSEQDELRAAFYDIREQDPMKRYKFVYVDLSSDAYELGAARTAFSPDGRHWTIDKEAQWNKQHTDGYSAFVYNPYTGKYFFAGRPILGDRRVAIYQTEDFKHYEKPFVVLQPDCIDPPMTEFYGMPVMPYYNMFLGFLFKHCCDPLDNGVFFRGHGRIVPELTYSINGMSFQRASRQPLIRYDSLRYGQMYPASAVLNGDRIFIYSFASINTHGEEYSKSKTLKSGLSVSSIRKDGFCALENSSQRGEFCLRPMIYRGGDITINASTSAYGRIRAELRNPQDHGDSTIIEGFTLEDSIPVAGDSCSHTLRWKNADLSALKNKPVMLRIELTQARVYAVRMQGIYRYGFVPLLDLSGSFIPGHWWDTVDNFE